MKIKLILISLVASSLMSQADLLIDFGGAGQATGIASHFTFGTGAPASASGTVHAVTNPGSSARIGSTYSIANFYDIGSTTPNGVLGFNAAVIGINDMRNDYVYLGTGTDFAITVELCNAATILKPNQSYTLYLWGQGDNANQGSAFDFDSSEIDALDPAINGTSQSCGDLATGGQAFADPNVVSFSFTTGPTIPGSLRFNWYRALEGAASNSGFAGLAGLAIIGDTNEDEFVPGAPTSISANGASLTISDCAFPSLATGQISGLTASFANLTSDCTLIPISSDAPGLTYSSQNPAVATVSSTGVVTYQGVGSTNIEVSFGGSTDLVPVTVNLGFPAAATPVHRYSFNSPASTGPEDDGVEPDLVGSANGRVWDAQYDGNGLLVFDNNGLCPFVDLPNGLFTALHSGSIANGDAFDANGSFAIEWWAASNGTGGNWQRFFSFGISTTTGTVNANYPTLATGEDTEDCLTDTGNGKDFFDVMAKVGPANSLRVEVNDNSGPTETPGDDIPLTTGVMTHWMLVWDSECNQISFYRDGQLEQVTSAVFGNLALSEIIDVNNWIGRPAWSGNALFNGSFDEVRFYTGVPTQLQVSQSFSAGPDATTLLPDPGTIVSITSEPATLLVNTATADEDLQLAIDATFTAAGPFEVTSFATTTYVSSDPSVASVDAFGKVTLGSAGSANITVQYAHPSGTRSVVVPVTVENFTAINISWDRDGTNLNIDGDALPEAQFTATADTASTTGTDVTDLVDWSSSNFSVADFSFAIAGLLEPLAVGTTTLTAELGSLSDTFVLTVSQVAASPTVRQHHYTFNYPSGATATATIDSQSGADGVVAGSGFSYDGSSILLPGGTIEANTTTAAHVALPAGLISGLSGSAHTFEIWVTWTDRAVIWERIFDFGSSTLGSGLSGQGDSYLYFAPKPGGGGLPRITHSAGGGVGGESETPNLVDPFELFPSGSETHVVLTYDSVNGIAKFYINGVLVDSDYVDPSRALSGLDDLNNWLGRSQWGDPLPQISINEFNIYNGIFTQAQVDAAAVDTATVLAAPTTLEITDCSYSGPGNAFIISFKGSASTTYSVESSASLLGGSFTTISGVTATTDGSGVGTMTIPAGNVGSGKNFFRISE